MKEKSLEHHTEAELLATIDRCITGAQRASQELRRREKTKSSSTIAATEPDQAIPQSGIAGS